MKEEPKSKIGNFFKKLSEGLPKAIPAALRVAASVVPGAGPTLDALKNILGSKKTGSIGDQLLGELGTFNDQDWLEWKKHDRENQLEELAIHNANTEGARSFSLGIQNNPNAHFLAKVTPYIIDLAVTLLFCTTVGSATFKVLEALFTETELPDMTTLMALIGTTGTVFGVTHNFHRGSSYEHQNKDTN